MDASMVAMEAISVANAALAPGVVNLLLVVAVVVVAMVGMNLLLVVVVAMAMVGMNLLLVVVVAGMVVAVGVGVEAAAQLIAGEGGAMRVGTKGGKQIKKIKRLRLTRRMMRTRRRMKRKLRVQLTLVRSTNTPGLKVPPLVLTYTQSIG